MATNKDAAEGKKSGKGKLIVILILLILILGGAGGGWYWWTNIKNADEAEEETTTARKKSKKKQEAPVFVSLDPFTVNLQGDDEQLLQTAISLQMIDAEDAERIQQHMPLIRSRLVMLLSSKHAEEIMTIEGKNKLAQEVAEQIKQPFSPADYPIEVQNVLFTSFIIQ